MLQRSERARVHSHYSLINKYAGEDSGDRRGPREEDERALLKELGIVGQARGQELVRQVRWQSGQGVGGRGRAQGLEDRRAKGGAAAAKGRGRNRRDEPVGPNRGERRVGQPAGPVQPEHAIALRQEGALKGTGQRQTGKQGAG